MRRRQRGSSIARSLVAFAAVCLPIPFLLHLRISTQNDVASINHRRLSLPNDVHPIPKDRAIVNTLRAFHKAGPLSASSPPRLISPYTLDDIILSALPTFEDVFGVVIYDPASDRFILHYSKHMRWTGGCHKLVKSFRILAHSLRTMFPDRFARGTDQRELALAISSGDYPEISLGRGQGLSTEMIARRRECYLGTFGGSPCVPPNLPPVLQFGSVFKSPETYPSMIAMPLPQHNHISCYQSFAVNQKVCARYLPSSATNWRGLVFGDSLGLEWEELIPQVIWRGTDFSYLDRLHTRLRKPDFEMDVASKLKGASQDYNLNLATARAMREVYPQLVPRWKSVVLTAEAECEAEEKQNVFIEGQEIIPWANMKFAAAMHVGVKTPTSEIPYYQEFEKHGIPAIGEGMSLETLARYKYHIDIGGGGGTTWSGSLEKLGLPGLLFHHETPMKDYLHEKMVKWVHYVPIKEDLSDLKEKFDWAETHPELAKRISNNATRLAKILGTQKGFSIMFNEFYENPLRGVIEAYQPSPNDSADWLEAMIKNDLRPIIHCSGYYSYDCEGLVDDVSFSRASQLST